MCRPDIRKCQCIFWRAIKKKLSTDGYVCVVIAILYIVWVTAFCCTTGKLKFPERIYINRTMTSYNKLTNHNPIFIQCLNHNKHFVNTVNTTFIFLKFTSSDHWVIRRLCVISNLKRKKTIQSRHKN